MGAAALAYGSPAYWLAHKGIWITAELNRMTVSRIALLVEHMFRYVRMTPTYSFVPKEN